MPKRRGGVSIKQDVSYVGSEMVDTETVSELRYRFCTLVESFVTTHFFKDTLERLCPKKYCKKFLYKFAKSR